MKKTILIVEDEKPLLMAMQDKLTISGYEVIPASDGQIGLRLALEKKPDLILLDIVMPTMDGMVVMEKIRADQWGKAVPIIFLTNLGAEDQVIQRLIKNNNAHYCTKVNTSLSNIIEKIQEIID